MLDLLFVYGTLRSEFNNRYARLLRKEGTLVGRAVVRGSIYRVRHFPGFRPEPDGEVQGELYRLLDPAATLAALDGYEGVEFERVLVKADTSVGPAGTSACATAAWIYLYRLSPPEQSRIVSGDFRSQ